MRAALAIGVMFPQIVPGAAIAFSRATSIRTTICAGRLFPSIGALTDQRIGGIVELDPAGDDERPGRAAYWW